MSNKVAGTVQCGNCDAVLSEDPNVSPNSRQPCPYCGSKIRKYSVNIGTTITVYSGLKFKHKRPGIKKPLSEGKIGASWYARVKRFVQRQMIIDREKDTYKEIIYDPYSGEDIHECHESLSSHKNHGTAKKHE